MISIGIFAFLGVFVAQLGSISGPARAYPLFLILCSALLNGALLIRSLRNLRREQAEEQGREWVSLLIMAVVYTVLFALYVFLMDKLGYILSTLLFIEASLLYLKVRSLPQLVLLPLTLTFSMYFLFTKFLMVTLPTGSWLGGLL